MVGITETMQVEHLSAITLLYANAWAVSAAERGYVTNDDCWLLSGDAIHQVNVCSRSHSFRKIEVHKQAIAKIMTRVKDSWVSAVPKGNAWRQWPRQRRWLAPVIVGSYSQHGAMTS
jgi:hypothetical protein